MYAPSGSCAALPSVRPACAVRRHTYTYIYIYTDSLKDIYIYMYIYIHTYTHKYIYIYIHISTFRLLRCSAICSASLRRAPASSASASRFSRSASRRVASSRSLAFSSLSSSAIFLSLVLHKKLQCVCVRRGVFTLGLGLARVANPTMRGCAGRLVKLLNAILGVLSLSRKMVMI